MTIYIFTGSGISVESGIQPFRGNGLWDEHKIEEICTYHTWRQNEDKIIDFYNQYRLKMKDVQPNDAHYEIARWQKEYETVLLTQNVDDLFEKAGCNPIHLHGSILDMECDCCHERTNIGYTEYHKGDAVNHNEDCKDSRYVKPGVVFFGEIAPNYQHLYSMMEKMTGDDILVVVGTSFQVIPIDKYVISCPAKTILVDISDQHTNVGVWDHAFIETASSGVRKAGKIIDDYCVKKGLNRY